LIIIFNGPPGSGKDEAAEYFKQHGLKHFSFKQELFKETIAFFKVNEEWFMKGYEDRSVKEKPEKLLNGMSRRDAMIHVSEDIIKPRYGQSFFGDILASGVDADTNCVISDGGFIEELNPVINKVGTENVILVQLTRDGCDYSTDSRRYFDGTVCDEFVIEYKTAIENKYILNHKFPIKTYRIHNNGSKESFHEVLHKIFSKEVKGKNGRKEAGGQTKDFSREPV